MACSARLGIFGNVFRRYPGVVTVRKYAAPRKKFYRSTGILQHEGNFEVTLDQRKLKTPMGNVFQVPNEPLALAIAAEWDAQDKTILSNFMYLTSLCNVAIDNPNNITKYDLVQYILNYLDTDTILFRSGEADELNDLQKQEWDPIVKWFCQNFQVEVKPSGDITGPVIDSKTKDVLKRHLLAYNFWAVHGISFGVESVKSLILTLAAVERYISVEKCVLLSRLETEFQTGRWGRVEWAHDLDQQETQARLAAAVLFIHLNSNSSIVQSKSSKDK